VTAILVVEDDENICQMITRNLNIRGYDTLQAASAREGLQILKKFTPQLLVLDIRLPSGVSGWLMLKEIDNNPALPKLPVIIMTASFSAHQRETYPYPNIVGQFKKPFAVKDLLQVVSAVC
jgi:two-component system cell cycle response regulator DivK